MWLGGSVPRFPEPAVFMLRSWAGVCIAGARHSSAHRNASAARPCAGGDGARLALAAIVARDGAACQAPSASPTPVPDRPATPSKASGRRSIGCANAKPFGVQPLSLQAELRRPPYNLSPTSGCPREARCTRIWCVRPVCSVQRTAESCTSLPGSSHRCAPACRRSTTAMRCAVAGRARSARRWSAPTRHAVRERAVHALHLARGDRAHQRRHRGATWPPPSGPLVSLSSRCTMPARGSCAARG